MTITRVGEAEGSAANGNGVTITLPSLQQNDVVLVMGAKSNTTGTATGVSTAGYTKIAGIAQTGVDFVSVHRKIMGASPDTSVACLGNGQAADSCAYVVMAFRGVDTAVPEDATPTTIGPLSGVPDNPAITTVTDGAAVVAFGISSASDATVTAPAGYGDQVDIVGNDDNDVTVMAAWKIKPTAGSENPAAWTNVTSAFYNAVTIALRPAPTGYTLAASAASFVLSGSAAALAAARALMLSAGSFILTGTAATLRRGYSLRGESGTMSIGAEAATLLKDPPWVATAQNPGIWTTQTGTAGVWTKQ